MARVRARQKELKIDPKLRQNIKEFEGIIQDLEGAKGLMLKADPKVNVTEINKLIRDQRRNISAIRHEMRKEIVKSGYDAIHPTKPKQNENIEPNLSGKCERCNVQN